MADTAEKKTTKKTTKKANGDGRVKLSVAQTKQIKMHVHRAVLGFFKPTGMSQPLNYDELAATVVASLSQTLAFAKDPEEEK